MRAASAPFPSIMEMHDVALGWAADRETHDTDDLKAMLAGHFGLGPDALALTLKDGRQAFSNRVDWLTARWTLEGVHTGSDKHYRLTPHGRELALRLRSAEMENEIAMAVAEGSTIDGDTQRSIDDDLDATAMEGLTEERRAEVRLRAAWLADRFLAERRRAGMLRCDECGFDPEARTAGTGVPPRSLMDVHHKRPLDEGVRRTTVSDFALLCPTCHRLVHALMRPGHGPVGA